MRRYRLVKKSVRCGDSYTVTLTCGHTRQAVGRGNHGMMSPPKQVHCHECESAGVLRGTRYTTTALQLKKDAE